MKRLILASGSRQRRKLLGLLGIPFVVRPSRLEEIQSVKTTAADLVKTNALLKARDVARHVKAGIVLGADTVVFVGRRTIIGKPRNFRDARRILKILFKRPQWVYTGVAVVDAATGKRIVDYEKTKVFMLPLTDAEIDRYHAKVNPFDKAGGFDIEGWGSIFIHRIEGCYSNVIGLPMAKVARMLKSMGVKILSVCWAVAVLAALVALPGCTTEYNLATQQEEFIFISTDKEIRIGENVAQQIEKELDVVQDVDMNARAERILDRIVAVCDRKNLVYFIKILDDEEAEGPIINAVSLPGGYVYVFQGLMEKVASDDELAGVIAHEVGHITAKHGIKRLQASYGALLLQLASTQAGGQVASGMNLALASLFMEHSQQAEFEADRLAVKYMKAAGFDPQGVVGFLKKLEEEQEKAPIRPHSYWRTHPYLSQRVAVANQEITGQLEFRDYLNLIGNE